MGEFESLLAVLCLFVLAQYLLYRRLLSKLIEIAADLGDISDRQPAPSLLAPDRIRSTWPNDHQDPTK